MSTQHKNPIALWAWLLTLSVATAMGAELAQPLNSWVKRTPLDSSPPSPRLGYEGACVWDPKHQLLVRYGGHNQGGGGEQGAEVWTFDPLSAQWTLKEPNLSPPGVCCNAQNVFDPEQGRYLRFPLFSGSHGWQWRRELYLNDSSVWSYDLDQNTWRNLRPLPTPRLAPLRCASWDSDEQVVVIFGGEGSQEGTLIYDPYLNEWRWPRPKIQPEFRSGGQMAYDAARKLHVLFGAQFSDDPHTWLYDVRKNEWRDAKPALMPPTDQNDAVLTYDPVNQVILAMIKITVGKEEQAQHRLQTWSYDTGANAWTKLNPLSEPDPSGNRARQLIFAPELNLAILENCPSRPREQQIWTYRYAETNAEFSRLPAVPRARPQPRLVEDLMISVISPSRVELNWKASNDPSPAGYHIERAWVQVLTEDQLPRLKRNTAPLAEPSVGAIERIGPFQRLAALPGTATTYADTAIDLTKTEPLDGDPIYSRRFSAEDLERDGKAYRFAVYAYRIRAVNADGIESGPSSACFTLPSSPQWLFSKDDGPACELKWAANPEKEIRGYRIYRMDGRYDNEPISRLTPEPVNALNYRDAAAGKPTRRYYVVAVDVLGQEGFPSSPVWFNREWRRFYLPFIGEWHQ